MKRPEEKTYFTPVFTKRGAPPAIGYMAQMAFLARRLFSFRKWHLAHRVKQERLKTRMMWRSGGMYIYTAGATCCAGGLFEMLL